MGLLDFLKKKPGSNLPVVQGKTAEVVSTQKPLTPAKINELKVSDGKYNEECALCGKLGTDKKWAGQFWHTKCMRNAKRMSKKMI